MNRKMFINLCWINNEVAMLRHCDWSIREESIICYAQRLVRRRIAIILRPHCRPTIRLFLLC